MNRQQITEYIESRIKNLDYSEISRGSVVEHTFSYKGLRNSVLIDDSMLHFIDTNHLDRFLNRAIIRISERYFLNETD